MEESGFGKLDGFIRFVRHHEPQCSWDLLPINRLADLFKVYIKLQAENTPSRMVQTGLRSL